MTKREKISSIIAAVVGITVEVLFYLIYLHTEASLFQYIITAAGIIALDCVTVWTEAHKERIFDC